jgi:hypothetical protein
MKRTLPLLTAACMLLIASPAMATPRITAASFTQAAGGKGVLIVGAIDPRGEVNGIAARFGENDHRASSSCVYGARPRKGKPVGFRLSYTFERPGTYTIAIRVTSSRCNTGRSSRSKLIRLRVVVAPIPVA